MNKMFYIGMLILVSMACRKEDPLKPSDWVDYFDVPEGASDEESVLRRQFKAETGCYLLFNDTLRKELIRYDQNGESVYAVETVDLSYSIASAGRDKQSFRYLNSLDRKKEAVAFIKNNLLTLMPQNNYPYSVLLVDSIYNTSFSYEQGEEDSGIYLSEEYVRYISGNRCLALSAGDIGGMTDIERKEVIIAILQGMITNRFAADARWSEIFYVYYTGLYGLDDADLYYDYWEEAEGWNYNPDVREFGFLSGSIEYEEYLTSPTRAKDLEDYLKVLLAGNEEEFLEENAEFPIVLNKYRILKEIIASIGFDLSKVL